MTDESATPPDEDAQTPEPQDAAGVDPEEGSVEEASDAGAENASATDDEPAGESAEAEAEADADAGEASESGGAEDLAAEALAAAQAAISNLSDQATDEEAAPVPVTSGAPSAEPTAVNLPHLAETTVPARPEGIDLLSDVNLHVKIELGRTRMLVEDVLKLRDGAVVELDKLAGDPVDIYVNDRAVARGEVLILNDSFCVRISEIIETPKSR